MDSLLWSIAILFLHPYQKVFGPANAFGFDLESRENSNFDLNLYPGFHEFSIHPLELAAHPTVHESPLLSGQTALDRPGPTELAIGHQYASRLDLPTRRSKSHSVPNILLGSMPHDMIPEADPQASARKRAKLPVRRGRHPPKSLNYILPNNELPINAQSQPCEGLPPDSTDPNYPTARIEDGPGLVCEMILPTAVQFTRNHVTLPSLNHQLECSQTGTHRQKNLKPNPKNPQENPDHPTRTSNVGLGIQKLQEKYNDGNARAFDNGDSDKKTKKTLKRKKVISDEPITSSCHAFTASRENPRHVSMSKVYRFHHRWIDFEPSMTAGYQFRTNNKPELNPN